MEIFQKLQKRVNVETKGRLTERMNEWMKERMIELSGVETEKNNNNV